MPDTGTKVDLAVEDISFDTAGTGANPATFSRTQSNGAVGGTWTKVTADAIPVIDRPIVTSARSPWAAISPASDRDVERCLQEVRSNVRDMKNFEHYGGTPGSAVDVSTAQRNVEVLKTIIDELAVVGDPKNGIFFPGREYRFHINAGLGGLWASHTIGIDTIPGLMLVGTGGQTVLKKHGSDVVPHSLFYFEDCGDLAVADMTLDSTVAATSELSVSNTATLSGVRMSNLAFVVRGCDVGSSSFLTNSVWIEKCTGQSIIAQNIGNSRIRENILLEGIQVYGVGGAIPLNDIQIAGNSCAGSTGIYVLQGGTYTSSIHRNILIDSNVCSLGYIATEGVQEVSVTKNRLLRGGVVLTFLNMTSVANIHAKDNFLDGSSAVEEIGIDVVVNGSTLYGLEVSGGRINQFRRNGIRVACSNTGIVHGPDIHGIYVRDCSREDIATDYDAILLDAVDGTSGCLDGLVRDNRIRTSVATAGGHYYDRAVHERGTGAHARNVIWTNHMKGFKNAGGAVTVTGAGSVDGTQALEEAAIL